MNWFSATLALGALAAFFMLATLYLYRAYLDARARKRRELLTVNQTASTALSVVIPVLNEGGFITRKLKNLFEQDYPAEQFEVLVVDGGSTDSTLEEVRQFPQVQILRSTQAGKIPQLNLALREILAQRLVVVTDADALFQSRDSLQRMASHFQARPDLGLVGGSTHPANSQILWSSEYRYWERENELRFRETAAGSSSIVVAPLYAFRRSLVDQFPEDCVADDIFISWRAHLQGKAIVYDRLIPVVEARQPGSWKQLVFHKFRKGNAYSRELVRVFPHRRALSPFARVLYLYRGLLFFVFPLLVAFSILATLSALNWPALLALAAGAILLRERLVMGAVLAGVLLVNLLVLPFWRQNSIYGKVSAVPA